MQFKLILYRCLVVLNNMNTKIYRYIKSFTTQPLSQNVSILLNPSLTQDKVGSHTALSATQLHLVALTLLKQDASGMHCGFAP